jgi:hypothetical protein
VGGFELQRARVRASARVQITWRVIRDRRERPPGSRAKRAGCAKRTGMLYSRFCDSGAFILSRRFCCTGVDKFFAELCLKGRSGDNVWKCGQRPGALGGFRGKRIGAKNFIFGARRTDARD